MSTPFRSPFQVDYDGLRFQTLDGPNGQVTIVIEDSGSYLSIELTTAQTREFFEWMRQAVAKGS